MPRVTSGFKPIPDDDGPPQGNGADKPLLISQAKFLEGFVPPDYLVDGIFQRRFIYALTGVTGGGKTAIALLLARAVGSLDCRELRRPRRRERQGHLFCRRKS